MRGPTKYRFALAALLSAAPLTAYSATYTYDFTAELTDADLDDGLEGAAKDFQTITTLTGELVFDDAPISISGLQPGLAVFAAPGITIDQFSLAGFDILPSFTVLANDNPYPPTSG